jgi:hypothetical protein
MLRRLLSTRRRKVLAAILTGLMMGGGGVAVGFMLATATGHGEGPATIPSATTQAVQVNIPAFTGPAAGGSAPFSFTITNGTTTSNPVHVDNIVASVKTTSVPACLPAWFTITAGTFTTPATSGPGTVPFTTPSSMAAAQVVTATGFTLNMPANTTVDQSSCAGAVVTVQADVS